MLEQLPVYQPGRPIEEVARQFGLDPAGIIKLASNENPLGPSRLALRAARAALRDMHLYPDGNAYYLKQKLAAHLRVRPENIILGNGSNEVLELIGHAVLGPGAEAVVSQYCFAVYPIVTHLFGARLVEVPARNYGHDLDAMLGAVGPATRVIFVANPNNPTGTRVPNVELLRFVNSVPAHVLVVIDEAYYEYMEDPPDLIELVRSGARPNLVVTRTFSKIYGLAGLRLGYGIAHESIVSALEKIRQPFNTNAVAQAAALAALDDTAHVRRTRALNRRGLRYFARELKRLGLEFVPSEANFILVRVGDGRGVFERMQQQGVIVRPMGGYGLPDWVRITTGTHAQNVRCIDVLKSVLGLGAG